MPDPLRRLKFLPWRSLLQSAALTTALTVVLDFLLALGSTSSPVIHQTLSRLYSPPLDLIVTFTVAVGVGALAVYLLERLDRSSINTASLWTLVLCLALLLFLKSLLVPTVLVDVNNEIQLVGIIIGVFWKSRPYWR